jgi:hypothetical protein
MSDGTAFVSSYIPSGNVDNYNGNPEDMSNLSCCILYCWYNFSCLVVLLVGTLIGLVYPIVMVSKGNTLNVFEIVPVIGGNIMSVIALLITCYINRPILDYCLSRDDTGIKENSTRQELPHGYRE